ncbi:hypothetical protein AAHB49_25205 [Bacillus cereus]
MKNLARRRLSVGTIPQREAVIATAKKKSEKCLKQHLKMKLKL